MNPVALILLSCTVAGFLAALYGNVRYDKRLVLDDLLGGVVAGLAIGIVVVFIVLGLLLAGVLIWPDVPLRRVVMT